jgi:tetratricopeptide (TPR) repeat protein
LRLKIRGKTALAPASKGVVLPNSELATCCPFVGDRSGLASTAVNRALQPRCKDAALIHTLPTLIISTVALKMPWVSSFSIPTRFQVGDLVYRILPGGAREGPYYISRVFTAGRYNLYTPDGRDVPGDEVFFERDLDIVDTFSADTGATENTTAAADSTSQYNLDQTAEIHDSGTANEKRPDAVLPGHTNSAVSLINLSASLYRKYERAGSINDLNEAIQALQEAIVITSPNHNYQVSSLNNLSVFLCTRYQQTSLINDLDEAIQTSEKALAITFPNQPNRAALLSNLGIYLGERYGKSSSRSDLDRAIEVLSDTALMTPKGVPDRPDRLTNLGIAFRIRFEETRNMEDLEEAIRLFKLALDDIPEGHPRRAPPLNNLDSCLRTLYKLLGSVDDINRAVEVATEVVKNTPEDHLDRVSLVGSLEMLKVRQEAGTTGSLSRPSIPPTSLDENQTTASEVDTTFSQQHASTNNTETTSQAMDTTKTGRKQVISETAKMEWVATWVDEQLSAQDVSPNAESVTFTKPFNDPTALPDTLVHFSRGSVPEQPVNQGADNLDYKVIPDWETVARSRAARFIDEATHSRDSLSLTEVVRDRIWPFYANWLHEVLGPCTRTAEFDWSDERDATSVTIYITCKNLPQPWLQEIIKDCTYFLVPDEFKGDDQVVVRIGQGGSTRSCSAIEILHSNSGLIELKMGDGIMSSVAARVNGDLVASEGSSGPWLRTSSRNVYLYTNEHVVRRGTTNGHMLTMTYPGRIRVGDVVLTSGEAGQNKDDAIMKCNNPDVDERVREKSTFLADWAVVKFEQAPTKPIETPAARGQGLCLHIKRIIHIPRRGTAVARGAGRRNRPGEPWTAAYTTHINGDGVPTVLSPRMFNDNSKELACWSLSRPRGAPYDDTDWYENGIGQPGDSGAGVVDCTSGHLCGLLVGQTKNETFNHRTAHMIDLKDVIIDTIRASKASQNQPDIADFYTAELIPCDCILS